MGYYPADVAGVVTRMRDRANYLSQQLGMCSTAEELHVWATALEGKS
jgi:hypothetical protein